MSSILRIPYIRAIIPILIVTISIIPVILADEGDYYSYGGGFVHGQILGFNWFDELIPIIWADVTAWRNGELIARAYSGGGGYYEIFLSEGYYTLQIEERGYKMDRMDIFVSSGSSSTINFILYLDYEYHKKPEREVKTYTTTLSVTNMPSDLHANLWVDDEPRGVIKYGRPRMITFPEGTSHIIKVDKTVEDTEKTRYVLDKNTLTVSSTLTHTFEYNPEFYITYKTIPSEVDVPSIEGWYRKGEKIRTNKAPKLIELSSDTRLIFDSWLVDGRIVGGDYIDIEVDAPLEIILKYTVEYYVRVDSDIGEPKGSGWYQEEATAEISVKASEGIIVRKIFDGWRGDYSGSIPIAKIVVNKPMTVQASWRDDYTILIAISISIIGITVLVSVLIYLFRRKG